MAVNQKDEVYCEEFIKQSTECYDRIKDNILRTPLIKSKWLSSISGRNVFLKLESEQITGSFKLRGASNKLLKLYAEDKLKLSKKPLYTASSGNHALACCHVADILGINLKIFLSNSVSKAKEEKLTRYSCVTLEKFGNENCEAEDMARESALENGNIFVSPYNDIDVVIGQSTIALEIFEQIDSIDAIIVPVGGGGLIAGIAHYAKLLRPDVKVIGVQPTNDCCMYESIRAGYIVDNNEEHPTFADGIAGKVEPGSITFEIVQKYVDHWIILNEEEIERAVYDFFLQEGKLVEGAAGLAIAAVPHLSSNLKNIVLVICGASIGVEKAKYIFQKYGH